MLTFGYGLGALGQGAVYYFMSAYFVVFLTNSVGLNSAIATTISSIALMVEVVTGMIIGNFSDTCITKYGKRRPFLFASAIAMFPIMFFMLKTIDGSLTLKVVYYLAFAILFRMFFSNYEIPHNAMGAEIVTDYNKRTRLRTIARAFSITGNAIGYVVPLFLLDLFVDEKDGWAFIGVMLAVVCSTSWLFSVILTREPEFIKKEGA